LSGGVQYSPNPNVLGSKTQGETKLADLGDEVYLTIAAMSPAQQTSLGSYERLVQGSVEWKDRRMLYESNGSNLYWRAGLADISGKLASKILATKYPYMRGKQGMIAHTYIHVLSAFCVCPHPCHA
jgi:hypothetical protein